MTEQMTGRQEAAASGRPPAGPPAAPSHPGTPGPSPRDLAARSPHRETAHNLDQILWLLDRIDINAKRHRLLTDHIRLFTDRK